MRRDQELFIKLLIGVVMLAVVSAATYLVFELAAFLSGGNDTAGSLAAAVFFLVGWALAVSSMGRQVNEWWNRDVQ